MKDFIVLIPHFNNPEGLITSLKSISYPADKYEVLIIDDGSKIPLKESKLKSHIPSINITVITMPVNGGIAKALNRGLEELHKRTDYKHIARLDCGDTNSPNRFTEQVKYLNNNTDTYLLGSWCKFTSVKSGSSFIYKTKTKHEDIIKEMHFKCSFIHPTVMFRREVLDTIGYYPENYPHAEDYAYFWEIIKKHQCALLPEVLVNIEAKMSTVSAANYRQQALSRATIIKNFGTNKLWTVMGYLLAKLRSILPYSIVAKMKKKVY